MGDDPRGMIPSSRRGRRAEAGQQLASPYKSLETIDEVT